MLAATVFSVEYTLTSDASYKYHIELDEASLLQLHPQRQPSDHPFQGSTRQSLQRNV